MKKSILFLGLVALLGFQSCSNDIDPISDDQKNLSLETKSNVSSENFTMKVLYHGINYDVNCLLENDSIIYLDEDFRTLYESKISKQADLVTVCHPDGSIEFFDSEEESMESLKYNKEVKDMKQRSLMREVGIIGTARLYDDKDFHSPEDSRAFFATLMTPDKVDDLLKIDDPFNDKTTAIKVSYTGQDDKYCAVLEAWENKNHIGRKLVCIAYKDKEHSDSDLNKVPCDKGNWSDRISSLVFSIAEVGTHTQSPHSK